jgi:hypothetical protein
MATRFPLLAAILAVSTAALPVPARAIGFQPVSADELKMTKEPLAPGAPAIILYRQVDRDDSGRGTIHEDDYYRIKILTEEGRKRGDIEIPFLKSMSEVVHIQARTIKPDGTIVDFNGKVFEKTLVKARGLRVLAKTFTLPAVEPGCVIEYSYTLDLQHAYASQWILSEELFTRAARFSLKPFRNSYYPVSIRWSWQNLPPGAETKEGPDHVMRLEAANIPAFQTEDYMPPPNELKSRVDFVYEATQPDRDADQFWKRVGKNGDDHLEAFVGKSKTMQEAVQQIVSPGDSPEIKLRKIYNRVQHLRNTTYEVRKTEQEEKRDKEKAPENVEEVWKRGYGSGFQLTWLYLALVRAAGFEAYGCWVSDRRQYFFDKKLMQSGKLDSNVVLVKLNGKDLFLDPGGAFTPYGLLTWSQTGVQGLRLDKEGGSWITTPLPASSESKVERTAKLTLSDAGDLEGKLTVTYTGLEAMYNRLENRNADEVARKKFLEDAIKRQIAGTAEAELTNQPNWSDTESPLVAEFDLKISGWASNSGKRSIFPAGIFSGGEKRLFEQENRIHPIYFSYPFAKLDEVSIELPSGWQTSSVPQPQANDGHIVAYNLKVANDKGVLHISRKLSIDVLMLETKYYPALRNFFQAVRSADEGQIVLQTTAAAASN